MHVRLAWDILKVNCEFHYHYFSILFTSDTFFGYLFWAAALWSVFRSLIYINHLKILHYVGMNADSFLCCQTTGWDYFILFQLNDLMLIYLASGMKYGMKKEDVY